MDAETLLDYFASLDDDAYMAALPPTFHSFADDVSAASVVKLIVTYPSKRIYIPVPPAERNTSLEVSQLRFSKTRLVALVGLDDALAIADVYGGLRLDIPNLGKLKEKATTYARGAAIMRRRYAGETVSQIAEDLQCTRRMVYHLCRKYRQSVDVSGHV